MDNKRIGAFAGIVSVLSLIAQIGPGVIVSGWIDRGAQFPGWAPTFGTAGQTMVVYQQFTGTIGPLVTVALALGLGYVIGKRVDLATSIRQFVGAVLIGSTVGLGVGWAVVLFGFGSPTVTDTASTFLVLLTFVQQFVNVALIVTVGTVAGAALGHFQVRRQPPQQPLESENQSAINHGD
jgi:hypothetical protein